MWSDVLVIIVALLAGGISVVTGFGIGSLLTPVLALQVDTRLARRIWFRRVLALILAVLGGTMLVRGM